MKPAKQEMQLARIQRKAKKTRERDYVLKVPQDSPTEQLRKELARDHPPTPGYAGSAAGRYAFNQLQRAAEKMAQTQYVYLSDEHIRCMAIMGTANEELMKYEMMRCRDRGWI